MVLTYEKNIGNNCDYKLCKLYGGILLLRADEPALDSVAIHFAVQTAIESGSSQEAANMLTEF